MLKYVGIGISFLVFFLLFPEFVHDFVDGFFDVIDPLSHLVDPADDVAGHFLEPLLHLLQHILHESIQLFGGGVFHIFLVHLQISKFINY